MLDILRATRGSEILILEKNLKISQTLGLPFSYMRYIEESGRILKQIFVQSIFWIFKKAKWLHRCNAHTCKI